MTHTVIKEMINRHNKDKVLCYSLIAEVNGETMRFDSLMDYSVADSRTIAEADCYAQLALADPE
jgi:hypothetical protein